MRPLKDAGVREVARLRTRARRALAMERALPADVDYIVRRLDEVEARIVSMWEHDEEGKEQDG